MQYIVVNGMGHAWSGGSNQGKKILRKFKRSIFPFSDDFL